MTKISELFIIFYHPKDPRNVVDIANLIIGISKRYGIRCSLIIVPRNDVDKEVFNVIANELREKLIVSHSLEEIVHSLKNRNCLMVVFETIARSTPDVIREHGCSECVAVFVGAEDYGIPTKYISLIESYGGLAVKIPQKVMGFSLNVVVSSYIALYEILRLCS